MIICIIVAVVMGLLGFGLGRIKNAHKLAAVHDEIVKAENSITTSAKDLAAKIKSHL